VVLFANIKQALLAHNYKRESSKLVRNRRTYNLEDAETVGLLFFIENPEQYQKALEIIKVFQDKKLRVQALGFINQKNYPPYFQPRIFFNIITLKDLNWYGKPSATSIYNFIKIDFDILIDLGPGDEYALQYISGLSKAKFKVGRYLKKNEAFYDLMINLDKKTGIDEFVDQVIHYLSLIKN